MINFLKIFTPGEQLEIFVLLIIFGLQIYFFLNLISEIRKYKNTFNKKSEISFLGEEEAYVNYPGKNSILVSIVLSINNYLRKNAGGVVDFHILKDIVDRNIDSEEEQIGSKISTPLYLGLVGTMVGIVIGLWNVDLSTENNKDDNALSNNTTQEFTAITLNDNQNTRDDDVLDIGPLINGVKYAMFVSVIGLFLTTYLSVWSFRRAQNLVNKGKHQFLSLLQTDLLPSLIRSEDAAIQELSQRLNHFSVSTPVYLDTLKSNTEKLTEGIDKELSIISQIQKLDIKRVSAANVEIFSSLSGMMDKFQSFPKYYTKLNDSLGNTIQLNKNLESMVSRTEDVNAILSEVKEIIESGSEATTFFNAHIQSFEKYADAVNLSVATTDQKMQTAVEQLGEAVTKQFEAFTFAVTEYDKKLKEAFQNSITEFNKVYKESVPKFEELSHLTSIDKKLDNTQILVSKVDGLKASIDAQNELLKNFEVSLPSDLNLNLKKEKKSTYYYIKEGITIVAIAGVIGYVTIELINFFV